MERTDEQAIWLLCINKGSWGDVKVFLEHDIISIEGKVSNLLRKSHIFLTENYNLVKTGSQNMA